MPNNDFQVLIQAIVDAKDVQSRLDAIKNLSIKIEKVDLDKSAIDSLRNQLTKNGIDVNLVLGNVNQVQSQAVKAGQQIGNAINKGVENSANKINQTLKSFSELKIGDGNINTIFDKEGLLDVEKSLDEVRKKYAEFGQVKITEKIFDSNGQIEKFKVGIQQVNGELKDSRSFMMQLSSDGKSFNFPDDLIKGSESYVRHLNEAKNITNATGEELNAQKEQLETQKNYYSRIKSDVNLLYGLQQKLLSADELQTSELNKQIKATKQRISYNNNQIDKKNLHDTSLDREITDLEIAKQKQLDISRAKTQDIEISKTQAQAQREVNATQKVHFLMDNGNGISAYQNRINKLISDFERYGASTEKAKKETAALQATLNGMSGLSDEQLILQADKFDQEFKTVKTSIDQAKNSYDKFAQPVSDEKISALIIKIQNFLNKNTAITKEARSELERYANELSGKNISLSRWNQINGELAVTESHMRQLGKLGKSLKDQFAQAAGSFTQWISVSSAIMAGVYKTKEALTELKEIDTYLTEISKANDQLSKSDLSKIASDSFDISGNYGKTATNYLSAVQEMSRAGYENVEGMAELSTAAQGAGDMTQELANKYIIATDKAYHLNGSIKELTKVLDGANNITNHNAVNMTELAEGMSVVGSQAASLGVDANEATAAMGTMIATTQQGGSEMARAFKAILLNIRQVSDADEGIDAKGLTKYEKACNALNVKLKETKNGVLQLRDPMEVLKDLSKEYSKLDENDIRRTNLLSSVGGKLRANALNALLTQWPMYEKMLNEYSEGTGSMAVEAEKTANSWEGSLNRLGNSWTKFIDSLTDQDSVVGAINTISSIFNGLTSITDKTGLLIPLLSGAGITAFIKNFDWPWNKGYLKIA